MGAFLRVLSNMFGRPFGVECRACCFTMIQSVVALRKREQCAVLFRVDASRPKERMRPPLQDMPWLREEGPVRG